jgi:hypothetical protein
MSLKPHVRQLRDGSADPFGTRRIQMVIDFAQFKTLLKLGERGMNARFGMRSAAGL